MDDIVVERFEQASSWVGGVFAIPSQLLTNTTGTSLLPLKKDHSKRVRSTVEYQRFGYDGPRVLINAFPAST